MPLNRALILLSTATLCACFPAGAQIPGLDLSPDRWTLHFQATSIGQTHGSFPSPYEGENSLPPHSENRVSLTATVFLAHRINSHIQIVVNPELAGGEGFGNVTGIAGFPNGEIPRVAAATPKLYLARAYLRYTWALCKETEAVDDGPNQLAGKQPVCRLTLTAGRFAISDFFDNNSLSHDPRRQFMNWALMSNGAWDYPADTRGYTIGTVQELIMRTWSLRSAVVMEPTEANGGTFDTRVAKNRGVVVEGEKRYKSWGHPGTMRVLGFLNRARSGTFREAILPDGTTDIAATRRPGTKKYGFGLNVEQEIAPHIGVFARYGWSDGKTEAWTFTQIDRSVSGGIVLNGRLWKRKDDIVGIAGLRNYLTGDDRRFLGDGGLGFIIGDGRLNYSPETIAETYYSLHVIGGWTATLGYQYIVNPAYNRDRGPVSVGTLRVHWER